MAKENETVIQYKQPINIEKPLPCSRRNFIASFVKEITLPFSKLKSWLKTQQKQQTICKSLNSSARERKSTQAREASDVNNTCSSSIAGDKLHVSFVASSQTHSYQPFMPSCKANICTQSYLILMLTNELSCLL